MIKYGTGTGMTELHRLSAASSYQTFTLQVATAFNLQADNHDITFGIASNDDLVGIIDHKTGTNMTEFHRVSASSQYKEFVIEVPTSMPELP